MINPFDKTFFKFLLGFICILAVSFGVLYVANNFGNNQATAALEIGQ